MKIMILSDSHSMTKQTLLQFIKNHPASYYIHCGDIYMPYTPLEVRSEERRVGKECRSRWSPYH